LVIILKKCNSNANSQGILSMQLNLSGLVCPMPIIKLKKFLAENNEQELDVLLTISDKSGLKDIPAFCKHVGLSCTLLEDSSQIQFRIQKVN